MSLATRCCAFLLLIIHVNLLSLARAGIFKDEESLVASRSKAASLKEQIHPGKIVVSNFDDTTWSDFLSATPIGLPEHPQTKTILSSAHNFLLQDNEWKKSNSKYKSYFCDSSGKKHKITNAIRLNDNVTAINDIAMYYLEDDVSCHPYTTIERDLLQNPCLRSLSCGWKLTSTNTPSICNLLGENPYYLENNNLYLNRDNIYADVYTVDRMVHLSNKKNEHRYSYFACNGQISPGAAFGHQIYMHDSGSSWFTENNIGEYSLAALASEEQAVLPNIIKEMDRQDNILGETHFQDDFFTLKVHQMDRSRFATNFFTPLAPHRDWIYRHIR